LSSKARDGSALRASAPIGGLQTLNAGALDASLRRMNKASPPARPAAGMLSLRIDLPAGRLGPGKIALLEAIDREGSISAAGRALGMSYKRAWDLVDALNKIVGAPVVDASPGGHRGGGALLTDAGRSLVADYRAIERAATRAAEPRLEALLKRTHV
jgi:molybdate transport system regulatory protein